MSRESASPYKPAGQEGWSPHERGCSDRPDDGAEVAEVVPARAGLFRRERSVGPACGHGPPRKQNIPLSAYTDPTTN